jgi:hypothetical protein
MTTAELFRHPRFYIVLILASLSLIPTLGLEVRFAGLFLFLFAFKQGFRSPASVTNFAVILFTALQGISHIYETRSAQLSPEIENLLLVQGLVAIGLWSALFSWLIEKSSSSFIYSAFAFIFFALLPGITQVISLANHQNFYAYLEKITVTENKALQDFLQSSFKNSMANANPKPTDMPDIESLTKQVQQIMTTFIPTFLSLGMMLFYYLSLRLSVNFVFPEHPARLETLDLLRIPRLIIWPVVAGWLAIMFQKQIPHWQAIEPWIYNLLLLIAFLYFVQGLGILSYYLKLTPKHRFYGLIGIAGVLALSFVLPMLFQAFLTAILGLGFFDQWFQYRKKFLQK